MKKIILGCECQEPTHNIVFEYDDEEELVGQMVVSMTCYNLSFLDRLKNGIKHILGFHQGDYYAVFLRENDIANLEEFFIKYRNGE